MAERKNCLLTLSPDPVNAGVGSIVVCCIQVLFSLRRSENLFFYLEVCVLKKRTKQLLHLMLPPACTIAVLLAIWQAVCSVGLVPSFLLPAPSDVLAAFINDFSILTEDAAVTLLETFLGLGAGILTGTVVALLFERFNLLYRCSYSLLIISQTIPSIAIAPLLILWMGYGIPSKVVLVAIMTFFPISIGLLDGFRSCDSDAVDLFRAMGATKTQILFRLRLPSAVSSFFSGLTISVSYSIVGAVIAEWLGGNHGLGVYMTRVRKSYSFDKMFAVIFLIALLSLILVLLIHLLEKKCTPWVQRERN